MLLCFNTSADTVSDTEQLQSTTGKRSTTHFINKQKSTPLQSVSVSATHATLGSLSQHTFYVMTTGIYFCTDLLASLEFTGVNLLCTSLCVWRWGFLRRCHDGWLGWLGRTRGWDCTSALLRLNQKSKTS